MEKEYFNPELKILTVGVERLRGWWNHKNLSAPHWRFYWNPSPGAMIRLNGKDYPLRPQEIALIPPNTPFSSSCHGNAKQLYVHFLAAPPYANVGPGIFIFPVEEELKGLLDEALSIAETHPRELRMLSLLVMRIVLAALMKLPDTDLQRHPVDSRIAAALQILAREDIPLPNIELARKACMSTNAFLRLFRQETGTSPQHYSRQCRIEQACLLLHYSDLDIKSIAEKTGFCDRYHFSRIFKALRGVSPAEFRKNCSGKQLRH